MNTKDSKERIILPSFFVHMKVRLRSSGGGLSEEGQTVPKGEELLAVRDLLPAIINSLLLDLSWRPPVHNNMRSVVSCRGRSPVSVF